MSLSCSRMVLMHFVGLLLPVLLAFLSCLPCVMSYPIFHCFIGFTLHSQFGFTILGQSRGHIGSHFQDIRHGSIVYHS